MNTPRACQETLRHAELSAELRQLVERFPHLFELHVLGTSREGREIWGVTVADRRVDPARPAAFTAPGERPALYVDGNIHATELTGSTACLALLHTLADRASTPDGATLLREMTFYVVPRVSPDGAEHVLSTGEYIRSSPLLYPHDDLPQGLHPKDLEGDGVVAQMRIEDPAGGWRVSSDDARVMVRRTAVDREGPFYRVYPEGLLHDFDGHIVREAPRAYGLDLNRNFPASWRPEKEQRGAGTYPLSEPETRAVAEFIMSRPNIGIFLALHTGIEVLLPPEGSHPWTDYPVEDRVLLSRLAAPGAELLKIPFDSLFPVDYGKIYGDFSEWLYEYRGIPGFVAEIWSPASRAGFTLKDQIQASRGFTSAEAMDVAAARWLDGQGAGDQIRPWKPFDHPQLGRVELGGWRQGVFSRAPDGPILAEIAQRVAEYAQVLARTLPKVQLRALDVELIAEDLYKVGATVINGGMMATSLTKMALQLGEAKEVEARLLLPPGATRLMGLEKQTLGHLEPYGGMGRAEWLVRAPGGTEIAVKVDGGKGGKIAGTVVLSPA